ncbi:hypothetical protein OpiT1DRAFT_04589 [Opitutaceae bacterium TAV1]|nr:hypothetical protein OpiT1DRAFT_04589 [Opitutaceae bacterium TAV1]
MSTATLSKPSRKSARKPARAIGKKAMPGSPLVGLEHLVGCVSLPPTSLTPREKIRARLAAKHNS